MDPEVIGQLVATARRNGALVTMDVLRNGDRRSLDALGPVLRHTDWFCPNEEQLLGLAECTDVLKAAHVMLEAGAGGVAVTRASRDVASSPVRSTYPFRRWTSTWWTRRAVVMDSTRGF